MGLPAKKKASAHPTDSRKPRIDTYAAFVCAQPFDMSASGLMRTAQTCGYEVQSVSAVQATRNRYKHLRFLTGDSPTAFVREFLASGEVGQKAKTQTAANSRIALRSVSDVAPSPKASRSAPTPVRQLKPRTQQTISSLVDAVLSEKKVSLSVAQTRKRGAVRTRDARQTLLVEAPDVSVLSRPPAVAVEQPAPTIESVLIATPVVAKPEMVEPVESVVAAESAAVDDHFGFTAIGVEPVGPSTKTPEVASVVEPSTEEPAPVAVVAASPVPLQPEDDDDDLDEEEEDDVLLQTRRDSFKVGDTVHVKQTSASGQSYTREGRIAGKETKFARVKLGSRIDKIAYKRLSLSPMSGRKARNTNAGSEPKSANSNGVAETKPHHKNEAAKPGTSSNSNGVVVAVVEEAQPVIRAVPIAFKQLESLQGKVAAPATQVAVPVVAEPTASPVSEPAPETPAAVVESVAVVEPAVVVPPVAIATPAPAVQPTVALSPDLSAWFEMGDTLEAGIRAEAAQKTQEIALEIERHTRELQRLTGERDAKVLQADRLAANIRSMLAQVSGT